MTYVTIISNPKLKTSQPQMLPLLSPWMHEPLPQALELCRVFAACDLFIGVLLEALFFLNPYRVLHLILPAHNVLHTQWQVPERLARISCKSGSASRVLGGTFTLNIPKNLGIHSCEIVCLIGWRLAQQIMRLPICYLTSQNIYETPKKSD